MTIVIHAGLKKCGSSSIHAFMRRNSDILKTLQIVYPGPGRPGTDLANEIQCRKNFAASRGTLSRLAEYWTNSPERTMVLSSEMLEETDSQQAVRVKEAFSINEKPSNFIIVLIVRDLTELIPSVYAQKIKDARIDIDFDTFFKSILLERRVNYFETAKRWADVFGWESMRVRVLDREHLLNKDLMDEFISLLPIDPADAHVLLRLKRPAVSNASPGWRVIESIRALLGGRHGLPERHPLVRAISRQGRVRGLGRAASGVGTRYEWNTDKGQYLTRFQAEQCLDIYRTAIMNLNQHLSRELPMPLDLEKRGFQEREFVPDSALIPPAQLHAFYDDLWAEVSAGRKKGRKSRQENPNKPNVGSGRVLRPSKRTIKAPLRRPAKRGSE